MSFAFEIRAAVQTTVLLAILGMILYLWLGMRTIRTARVLPFFRRRQEGMVRGWRMLLAGIFLAVVAFLIDQYAEPLVFSYFPPTATPKATSTITPTASLTPIPTITLTLTISPTPAESSTPTPTPTPFIPEAVKILFSGVVTPIPDSAFSALQFTQGIDENYNPLNPGEIFQNPVGHLYAVFTYNNMIDGVQWTALWVRDGILVYFETKPWDGGGGGFGYTDWNPDSEDWWPGIYQVQLFLGLELKVVGNFVVEGIPATSTITPSPTTTPAPPATSGPSPTITASPTVTRTFTPRPTYPPTITPTPTLTRQPLATPITPSPTITRQPTSTITPTFTPGP